MAGFDVTPPSASSSTSFLSPPLAIRLRRMKSSHTDWPWSRIAASLFAVSVLGVVVIATSLIYEARLALGLDGLDLVQAPQVALLVGEARLQERLHQLRGDRRTQYPRAQHEHVHVVVLDPLVRRVDVVTDGGAH